MPIPTPRNLSASITERLDAAEGSPDSVAMDEYGTALLAVLALHTEVERPDEDGNRWSECLECGQYLNAATPCCATVRAIHTALGDR
jgi:hypothetical protein